MEETQATGLLREIRDAQARQIELQTQALELQRQHLEAYRTQLDRVERINDRAEALQDRAGRTMRIAAWLGVPLLLVIALLLWPYLRQQFWGL
ncbi:MAG: hypothetical protein AVDCRST_MAG71-1827 [uncultured Lysobacter sp.]|uniref:Uncharacterized protein n=1 Tax=uncultured Lysobacter sp. TaxID=271060 RepID=A0A6J4LHS8_9GAMM|nr:MAG: hypothetical protein AVDCRST_MAG71-1827 [uncultured Lysobacter sp.]